MFSIISCLEILFSCDLQLQKKGKRGFRAMLLIARLVQLGQSTYRSNAKGRSEFSVFCLANIYVSSLCDALEFTMINRPLVFKYIFLTVRRDDLALGL